MFTTQNLILILNEKSMTDSSSEVKGQHKLIFISGLDIKKK